MTTPFTNCQDEHLIPILGPGSLTLAYKLFRGLLEQTEPPDTAQPVADPDYLQEAGHHLCLLSEAVQNYLKLACERLEQITPGLELNEPHAAVSDLMDDVIFRIERARERMIEERFDSYSRRPLSRRT